MQPLNMVCTYTQHDQMAAVDFDAVPEVASWTSLDYEYTHASHMDVHVPCAAAFTTARLVRRTLRHSPLTLSTFRSLALSAETLLFLPSHSLQHSCVLGPARSSLLVMPSDADSIPAVIEV